MAITVAIPTYNRRASVLQIVRSLIPQLGEEDEIVVVDDGSSDQADAGIEPSAGVRWFRNELNLGLVKNWNKAMQLATKPWICIIHDDDKVASNAIDSIRRIIKLTAEQPSVIAGGNIANVTEPLRFEYCAPGRYAVLNAPKIPSGVVLHRAVLDKCGFFDERFPSSPDLEYFPRLARDFPLILVDSPSLVHYQMHESNYQFKTWHDPEFATQLETIQQSVGEYAGLTGAELHQYVNSQMTSLLGHMLRESRIRNDMEVFQMTSRLLAGRENLGRRRSVMARMGKLLGWCPRFLVGR